MKIKSIQPHIIPTNLLLCIGGGKDNASSQPSSGVQVYVSGNSDGAVGKVGITVPVVSDITATPHISGNTTNKVTGGGVSVTYTWD